MAEDQKTHLDRSKDSIPSNEDLIDSLVTDFTKQCTSTPNTLDQCDKEVQNGSPDACVNDIETSEKAHEEDSDNDLDEVELEKLETGYTEEEKSNNHKEADKLKCVGNDLFKSENYKECKKVYTQALHLCPLVFTKDRAILYANRAAAKLKLDMKESAILDCTKAIELDSEYKKAILRRAQTYKNLDKLDEALEDYKTLSKLDPSNKEILCICNELTVQISERNEKMKTEMLGQLKNLGNMILRPFGLSTNNFQMVQDPNSGGYSINFCQNPNN